MRADRVVVVGAGVGGLVAALLLAARGFAVTLVERADAPGGKMREVRVGDARLDAGPTVFTMRWVFDEIFAEAGASFERSVALRRAEVLARHAWDGEGHLDLFADPDRSADAIGTFAGAADAQGFRRFCHDAKRVYDLLERPFIRAPEPSMAGLIASTGLFGAADLLHIRPFTTLWRALGEYFADPRLRQLFGRYATYCGSSPFRAPATLMLVAHVEQEGIWLVEGGMHRVALALAALAERLGATIRYRSEVREITAAGGRVAGVTLSDGERIEADAVVVNADPAALAAGLFGAGPARAVPAADRSRRSLSAVTWALAARAEGFPLERHNVFFSRDYAAEFDDIFDRGRLPAEPTVYVCAQDRGDYGNGSSGPERLLCLVNAPPRGDGAPFEPPEIERCEASTLKVLERCGLRLNWEGHLTAVTTPAGFADLLPGTGGALYGTASHGWRASFERPGCRTRLPGLYLAGGSVHPGPGVPMAALSGRSAAAALASDRASTSRSRRTVTRGGTSTA